MSSPQIVNGPQLWLWWQLEILCLGILFSHFWSTSEDFLEPGACDDADFKRRKEKYLLSAKLYMAILRTGQTFYHLGIAQQQFYSQPRNSSQIGVRGQMGPEWGECYKCGMVGWIVDGPAHVATQGMFLRRRPARVLVWRAGWPSSCQRAQSVADRRAAHSHAPSSQALAFQKFKSAMTNITFFPLISCLWRPAGWGPGSTRGGQV